MAEIVKPDGGTACGLESGAKMPPQHILVVDVIPGLIGEHQIQIIFRTGQPPRYLCLNV
jgi:hypothetical protein